MKLASLLAVSAASRRAEVARLLMGRPPDRVVIDPGLPIGTWIVRRAMTLKERLTANKAGDDFKDTVPMQREPE